MELEEAKTRIKSIYALIDDLADEHKIGKGVPSRILLDGHKIVKAEPQRIDFEATPLLTEFLEKHDDLWNKLSGQKWEESEARKLVQYEQFLWDQHFA